MSSDTLSCARTTQYNKQTTHNKHMKNDPKKMTSRFQSTCAESGKSIPKGAEIIYWPSNRAAYLIGHAPKAEQEFLTFQSLAHEEDHGYCTY